MKFGDFLVLLIIIIYEYCYMKIYLILMKKVLGNT